MTGSDIPRETLLCFLAVFICIVFCQDTRNDSIDLIKRVSAKHCVVWGPGLESKVVLPARFFFIQTADKDGTNLTDSVGDVFKVTIEATPGEHNPRVWIQILDRHDGSYIVRYKLFQSSTDLRVNVKLQDEHVGGSPFKLYGHVYHELCNCPQEDISQWTKDYKCPKRYRQIDKDLSIFPNVDMTEVAEDVVSRFNQRGSHSLCHYVIKDNKVYRKTHGQHVGFKMFSDAILLSITRKVRLPDVEFFINLGDWPLEKRSISEKPVPIFSWCGSDDTKDIVMPTYDMTESTLETMGRVTLDLLSVQANTGPKWDNKSSVAFWRGRDSRQERLDLVRMSIKNPDVIDAKLTNMFFFKKEKDLGELVKPISFFDFFKYKYQLNIDGTVAAYRLPYLLAGDALVMKQDSHFYEYFYKDLKPYEHYIPFKRDLSDLNEKLQWAKDHDEEVQKMAYNAQQFVRENLMSTNIFCYHVRLFENYAIRLVKPPEVQDDMELVEQPSDYKAECFCPSINKMTKDEL